MAGKTRLGCLVVGIVVVIAAMFFARPIIEKGYDRAFAKTQERVTAALPAGERREAQAVCETLWHNIKTRGIPPGGREAAEEFRHSAFEMLKNQEVTEEEAREFLDRARALLKTLYPDVKIEPHP